MAQRLIALFAISSPANDGIHVFSDSFGRLGMSGLVEGIMEIIASADSDGLLESGCDVGLVCTDAEEVAQKSFTLRNRGGCGRIGKTNMVAAY